VFDSVLCDILKNNTWHILMDQEKPNEG
jgi:hypothetical protein